MTWVEICHVEGRRGALVTYVVDGRRESHYLIPRAGTRPRPAALVPGLEGAPPLVTWAVPSLEQALVGDLAPRRLLELSGTGT